MIPMTESADELPEDLSEDEEDDEIAEGSSCPICELPAGECDHLVAAIDLTYSELIAGAIFAHQGIILDLLEQLAASDPEALKAAGTGPALENLAALIQGEMEEGASAGDAIAMHYPHLLAVLSHLLQDDGDVVVTAVEADAEEESAVENLWAQDPEWAVGNLIERLQEWAAEASPC
jgi:hypothetical protein